MTKTLKNWTKLMEEAGIYDVINYSDSKIQVKADYYISFYDAKKGKRVEIEYNNMNLKWVYHQLTRYNFSRENLPPAELTYYWLFERINDVCKFITEVDSMEGNYKSLVIGRR